METKVNYVVVGLFTLVLSSALVAGVLWLSAGKRYSMPFDIFVADMQESVSGLNLNAPVKYRGVEIGQVRKISLNKDNPEQVQIEMAIERGIPIRQDTIATLKSHGLTGIAFIELSGGSSDAPLLEARKKPPYSMIKTGPSLFGRLDASMSGLISNLTQTTESANAILEEDNRKAVKRILADLAAVTGMLAAQRSNLDKSIANTASFSEELPQLLERITRATSNIEKMTQETARASSSLRKTLDEVGPEARRFANEGLPEAERLMVSVRELTTALQRVTEQVEKNPSVLLRGSTDKRRGPGE